MSIVTFGEIMLGLSTPGFQGFKPANSLGAKRLGMPVLAVVSPDHCNASNALHSSGKKLPDIADITIARPKATHLYTFQILISPQIPVRAWVRRL